MAKRAVRRSMSKVRDTGVIPNPTQTVGIEISREHKDNLSLKDSVRQIQDSSSSARSIANTPSKSKAYNPDRWKPIYSFNPASNKDLEDIEKDYLNGKFS